MNTLTYIHYVGSFVVFTRGAFKGVPGCVIGHDISTVSGSPRAAYRVELCDSHGDLITTFVTDEWLASERGNSAEATRQDRAADAAAEAHYAELDNAAEYDRCKNW